jgi:hypothetical protein
MASEAYFVGRSELLSWINSTLDMRLGRVEEVSLGCRARVARCCGVGLRDARCLLLVVAIHPRL